MSTRKPTSDSPSGKLRWIRLEDFEDLCFNLTRELLSFNQPIPDFITRSPGILESCLESPLQIFDGKELYPSLEDKLAILFYLLIKNHPFQNGNKRIAVTTMFVILALNGRWLEANPLKLLYLAVEVSSSERTEKEAKVNNIKKFIVRHIIDRS